MSAAKMSSGLPRRMRSTDPVGPQIRAERLGDDDRAVRALIVLEKTSDGARERESRSVQCVNEAWFITFGRAKANVRAARLEIATVAARRHLEPRADAGRPRLEVVGHGRREAGIARREQFPPVRDA